MPSPSNLSIFSQDEDDDEGEDKLEQDFDMNKMLGQLRVGEDGKTKDIEDFDDLDDADSDDEGTCGLISLKRKYGKFGIVSA